MSANSQGNPTKFFDPFSKEECDDSIMDALIRHIVENDKEVARVTEEQDSPFNGLTVQATRTLLKSFDASFPVIDKLLAARHCKPILKNDLGVFAILAGLLMKFEQVAWALKGSASDDLERHRLGAMIEKLRQLATLTGKEFFIENPVPQEEAKTQS